jgi:aspartate-semialdehyde dehydrogenase
MSTPGSGPRVAVVGATGAVGSQLLELLAEREFPRSELALFASEGSAGSRIEVSGNHIKVAEFNSPAELAQFDVSFLAVPRSLATDVVAARPGGLLIDISAATRAPSAVPMVAAGLTPREQIAGLGEGGVLCVPHPAAHAIATLLCALGTDTSFTSATVMLGASASGNAQVGELARQSADLLNGRLSIEEDERQLAFNIDAEDSGEEIASAIGAQVAHLLGSQACDLAVRVMTVPVLHGTMITLTLPASANTPDAEGKLRAAPGVMLLDKSERASVIDAVGQEALLVSFGAGPHGVSLVCVFDNAIRAALNALWIAETMLPALAPKMN